MRLDASQAALLKQTIHEYMPKAKVYLFGSRADDHRRGGDIDILILGERCLSFTEKTAVQYAFEKQFGAQKLDLVSFQETTKDPFIALILDEAILL